MAFRTATGRVDAFGYLVTIETLGLNFGRLGWLDRIRIGVIDHDGLLYLASYD